MEATLIILQTAIPSLVAVGLTILGGATIIGRKRQKVRVKVKRQN